jgi:hypothetical protein
MHLVDLIIFVFGITVHAGNKQPSVSEVSNVSSFL